MLKRFKRGTKNQRPTVAKIEAKPGDANAQYIQNNILFIQYTILYIILKVLVIIYLNIKMKKNKS